MTAETEQGIMAITTIEPYGPGKFDTNLDEAVYVASLDGCDEEDGDIDATGAWRGLVLFTLEEIEHLDTIPVRVGLSPAHIEAAIVHENSDGFVTVGYYESIAVARTAWAKGA